MTGKWLLAQIPCSLGKWDTDSNGLRCTTVTSAFPDHFLHNG